MEHPFGTIKRQWGFDHIMTKKGLESASADFGLIALTYNLKRLINIIATHKDHRNTFFEILYNTFRTILSYLEGFYTYKQLKYENH